MAAIIKQAATVYRAPTAGRRYLSIRGAANAEAGALIAKKYPTEAPEYHDGRMTYSGFHYTTDERLVRVRQRLARRLISFLQAEQGAE